VLTVTVLMVLTRAWYADGQVGCGNSTFSVDMYAAGFRNITNIDFSRTVIDRMSSRYSVRGGQ